LNEILAPYEELVPRKFLVSPNQFSSWNNILYLFFKHSLQTQTLLTYCPTLIRPSFSTSGSMWSLTRLPHLLQVGIKFLTMVILEHYSS
jgi:hypothetical protein